MIKNSNKLRFSKGNALLLVLGAIAALAALGVMGNSLFSTVVSGNQRSSLNSTNSQILSLAAYTITKETTSAGGNYPVPADPVAWTGTNPTAAPSLGTATKVGLVPVTSTAPKVDGWGSNLGYCTFMAIAQGNPVFAVISAGPDKTFQTSCTQAFAATPQGDDGVRVRTAANVLKGVGGTVYFGDPLDSLSALEALTTAHAGEARITKDTGLVYINKTGTAGAGNWAPIGAGGSAGQGAPKTCTAGYILIAEFTLPDGATVPSFCVMQYEARKLGFGLITANVAAFSTTVPLGNVAWRQAQNYCASVDSKLITESQWLSIAHQSTTVASNWSGGAIGVGTLARGYAANAASNDLFTNTTVAPANDATCLYNTGADTCGASGATLYRRTLDLPNGSVIWDFSGNLMEWVDASIPIGYRYNGGTGGLNAYNTTFGDISPSITTYMPVNKRPPSGWNAGQGMGRYYDGVISNPGNNNLIESTSDCSTGLPGFCDPYVAFLRGGGNSSGSDAGVFALDLSNGRSNQSSNFGFRCSR